MSLTVEEWHQRYTEQSRWTASLRDFILQQIQIDSAGAVLEVGCGTGAVLSTIAENQIKIGLDINFDSLQFVNRSQNSANFTCADGLALPFLDSTFDLTFCHYLLLWLQSPLKVIQEMKRVTKASGYVIAFAEPDHAARIDAPIELSYLGRLQSRALEGQGVDLEIGRQLPALFSSAGFSEISYGVSGFQKQASGMPESFDSEWRVLENDLAGSLDQDRLDYFRERDEASWREGSRVLWIPTFYAIGRV
jgi:SAM-dependent methyltransferase